MSRPNKYAPTWGESPRRVASYDADAWHWLAIEAERHADAPHLDDADDSTPEEVEGRRQALRRAAKVCRERADGARILAHGRRQT